MSNIFNDPTETQLNERTINLQNLSVLQPTLPILDIDNVVTGQVASSAGLSLLNITSIADLRSQILENDTEEAIRLTADSTNEINFYTNGTTASELRMQITDATTTINNTTEADDIKVNNANKIICNTYGYRNDTTNPTYIDFDAQHAHFRSPNGIRINDHFQIDSTNGGQEDTHIYTTNTNKNIKYTTNGTGYHCFLVDGDTNGENANEILRIDSTDTTVSSTNLKTNNIVSNTDNTYSIGTSSNKYLNIYGNTLHTGTITTPTNTSLEITPNGSGNIRTNRPLEIPAAQSIMLCKENNKHFQLNLAPNNEAPNDNSASYGSGLTFWSSFYDTNDAAPRLFANINCRTVSPDWSGGSLEFRVREAQGSGFDGAISGDRAALTSHQMTITATTVDILKILNVSSHIIPSTDNTADLGEIPAGSEKRFRNGYINNVYTDTINTSNSSITLKDGVNDLLLLNNTETTSYKNIMPNVTDTLNIGSISKRWGQVFTNLLTVGDTISAAIIYSGTIQAPNMNPTTIDFPESLADKILLYGTTYKIGISNNSIDYTTDVQHTFKVSTSNLLILDNTNMTTYKTIIPDTTNVIDIGSSTKLFNNGYINTLKSASISPQTTDSNLTLSGNGTGLVNIGSILTAPLGAILGKSVINGVVAYGKFGVKSDGGALYTGNTAWDDNYSIFGHAIDFKNASNEYGLAVGIGTNSTSNYGVIKCLEPGLIWRNLHISSNGLYFDHTGTERMRIAGNIVCSTNLIPNADNTRDFGTSSNRWKEIYAGNGTINTSDRTHKKEIDYQNIDQYADELLNVKPCSYKFIDGTSNRTHLGLISQDLENGIYRNTGAFIKSPKTKTTTEIQIVDGIKSTIEKEVEIENEFIYGLRYSELISPLIRLCQIQQKQINDLVARVEILETGSGNELSFI